MHFISYVHGVLYSGTFIHIFSRTYYFGVT